MKADIRGDPAAAVPSDLLDLATDTRVRRLAGGRAGPVRANRRIRLAVSLIGAAAIVLPAATVRFGPARHQPYQLLVAIPGRVIPVAELPPVEPVEIRLLDPDAARAFNATVPFSTDPNPAARPFRPAGTADDLARATDCLAAAAYYEAGDDPAGQRAVAQVVLNRVRHPAFPKTVCGVVFQGSERTTGCQFTFTCDGSLVRYTPTPDSWKRARAVATAALAGKVDADVGYATHYHTNWVVPYWLASLDKIVAVHTQLFYRWTGWWGTPPAFNRHAEPAEAAVPALARLSDAHRTGIAPQDPLVDPAVAGDAPVGAVDPAALAETLGQFLVTLPAGLPAASWPAFANRLCGARVQCRVMAWRDKAHTATTLPLEVVQVAAMQFSYVRDRTIGYDRAWWNCRDAPRPDPRQCMKRQVLIGFGASADPAPPVATAPPVSTGSATPAAVSPILSGLRRTGPSDPVAAPAPTDPKAARPGERPRPLTPPGTSPAAAP
ncbi:cell wall hydrolase [uncultured Sphingomonas sp.]|uniref:cell wall hydrolase n=1 Tax=uncultured Sphingomonas sp. TaxID=158754 RepID=UPI0035C99007